MPVVQRRLRRDRARMVRRPKCSATASPGEPHGPGQETRGQSEDPSARQIAREARPRCRSRSPDRLDKRASDRRARQRSVRRHLVGRGHHIADRPLDTLVAANDQRPRVSDQAATGRRLEFSRSCCSARCAAPVTCELFSTRCFGAPTRSFRRAPVPTFDLEQSPLRPGVRGGSPRHLEFPAGSQRRVRRMRQGVPAAREARHWCAPLADAANADEFVATGRVPTVCWRWAIACAIAAHAAARSSRPPRNLRPGV